MSVVSVIRSSGKWGRWLGALLLLASSALGGAMDQVSASLVVATTEGKVRGVEEGALWSWKGIPFAAPPLGALRWRAPQAPQPWQGVRHADHFASDCLQMPYGPRAFNMRSTPSEDCLYLNIWKPSAHEGPLPVVVWIYGGGWVIGGTSAPIYSGEGLAKAGVMVVSLNYRIGHFGFFAHPALTQANEDDGLLFNYGILDQLAALRWLKKNLAAFGGDPDNITVMGESAGGVSIHTLLTSPLNEGLFHKAVIMSGANADDLGTGNIEDAERLGLNLAARLNISPEDPSALARLRALPAEQVMDELTFRNPPRVPLTFNGGGPVEDGRIVTELGKAYEAGTFKRMPIMLGATSEDLGGRTGFMVGGARRAAQTFASHGVPIFQYRFSYVPSASLEAIAGHAVDIPFFLQTLPSLYGDRISNTDLRVAQSVKTFLLRFATMDPRTPVLEGWPSFGEEDELLMDFTREGQAILKADPGVQRSMRHPLRSTLA